MTKLSDLSNRPFLIVDTIMRPSGLANTSKKGWTQDRANWQIFERPRVEDRVNNKALTEAQVIIDIMRGKVVKNRFDDKTDDEVCEHYLGKYMNECKKALDVWLTKQAKATDYDLTNVRAMAAEAREQALAAKAVDAPTAAPEAVSEAPAAQ